MKRNVLLAPLVFVCAFGGTVRAAQNASPGGEGALPAGRAEPSSIMPLKDVRPGMVGEGLTVFRGTKPEPFKFRVVSILRNFLPKQDVILIRVEDERVEKSGVAAGMSGSPVYIDGKVMGAVAYAWSFSKEPLAGVTPIESMLAEKSRPRRRDGEAYASGLSRAPAATLAQEAAGFGESRLERVGVPFAISGLTPEAIASVATELKALGLVPLRAGGGGPSVRPSKGHVEPGSAIGVELIRGDMSAVGTGTVTYVDGNHVFAFGHPMLGTGEVELPLVESEIHTFMPSLATSFKMASPLAEIGTLVQDRQSCIVGDLSRRTKMMPVRVTVSVPDAEPRPFRAEVARDKRLTPMLASMVLASAVTTSEPDPAEMVITVRTRLEVKGMAPIVIDDAFPSPEGLSPRALSMSRGIRALSELLANPFSPAVVERMDVDLRLEYRRDWAEVVSAALPRDEVEPGQTLPLRVTMRSFGGKEFIETIPVNIPRALAGELVKIEVASGALVKPDVARPENLHDFVELLSAGYTAASLIVSLSTPDSGVAMRGRLIPGLPPSALDTLRSANASPRADAYKVSTRLVHPFPRMAIGRKELTVRVREDILGRL